MTTETPSLGHILTLARNAIIAENVSRDVRAARATIHSYMWPGAQSHLLNTAVENDQAISNGLDDLLGEAEDRAVLAVEELLDATIAEYSGTLRIGVSVGWGQQDKFMKVLDMVQRCADRGFYR